MGFFSRSNLPRIKDGGYFINLDDKISKGTNFISLFFDRSTAIYNLIHLELNIFRKMYKTKSKINQLFRIYLEYKIFYYVQIVLYRFHRIYVCSKNLLDYTFFFLPMTIKKMTKQYVSVLRMNMSEKESLASVLSFQLCFNFHICFISFCSCYY